MKHKSILFCHSQKHVKENTLKNMFKKYPYLLSSPKERVIRNYLR